MKASGWISVAGSMILQFPMTDSNLMPVLLFRSFTVLIDYLFFKYLVSIIPL